MSQTKNANAVVSPCYVEVNNFSIKNVGSYYLNSGKPLFDIGIIFAANINYDTTKQKAYLSFNPNVQNVLDNVDTLVRPLQAKGIKVTLSVLGNHQGAGISNFPTQQAAEDFAGELAAAVEKYGLDGIDFDDEYAEYGNNGTGMPNDFSFVYLVNALRNLMPDKLITWYFIGPATYSQSYGGITVGSKIDYAWNPYYGTYNAPTVDGLGKSGLGAAAVDIVNTGSSTAVDFARNTLRDGYGVYMWYNLTDNDASGYLSQVSEVLYGEATVFKPI